MVKEHHGLLHQEPFTLHCIRKYAREGCRRYTPRRRSASTRRAGLGGKCDNNCRCRRNAFLAAAAVLELFEQAHALHNDCFKAFYSVKMSFQCTPLGRL